MNMYQDFTYEPGYIELHRSGELRIKGNKLNKLMNNCSLCPRTCGADRTNGEKGFCSATDQLLVASFHAHFGEESPLVGRGGSGTIFFSHCNLGCIFCQNWDISHEGSGLTCSIEDLSKMMLELQDRGCHNINLVTPTHYSPHILLALDLAAEKGLRIPLVYNTSGWERQEILDILEGVVDIYLADFKYMDPDNASIYSDGADTYPEITRQALIKMQRQAGIARPADDGLIYKGLMIRHLVMPNNVSGSIDAIHWISENLPAGTYVNIMSQYRPSYLAPDYQEINRTITAGEYMEVVNEAKSCGLTNLDK